MAGWRCAGNRCEWKSKRLEAPGQSCAFSPDGKVVAVGHRLGAFSVHRLDNMDELISARDRKKAIFSVTFAPNGRYLAVGSEDCFIDLYDCVSDYDWVGTLQGHSVSVRFVDWSLDSRCIQSTGHNSEILFWDVEQQTQIPSEQ